MFNYEKFNLTFSFSAIFFFITLIILAAYAFYVYRYTIPTVSPARRFFLTALRTLSLLLLLFIFFEPILSLSKKLTIETSNLIFIDNSKSILINDGTQRKENVRKFIKEVGEENLIRNTSIYSFGGRINEVLNDSLSRINFSEGSSNFSKIFSTIKKEKQNISSIVIVSDGVINEGENPLYTAEKLGVPVYTVGVGDTTERNDVELKNVLFNEFIYNETPTAILAAISNKGFGGKEAGVSFYENETLIESKNLILSKDGSQNINFNYTPKSSGEKKLTITVANQKGEFTYANNKKVFYVNVLSNKIKILLLAGAPSPDLSFIKNALKEDKNFSVNSITQIAQNKFLESNKRDQLIDSADIFFLISFPSHQTSGELLNKIKNDISKMNKPLFFLLSEGTDLNKLNLIADELGFIITSPAENYNEVQPYINSNQIKNPIIQNNSQNILEAWNNLPPIFQINSNLSAKPESEIIARIKEKNIPLNKPLILTRKLGKKRSINVLAKDIWKWKLQNADKNLNLFDSFILNSAKWLNTSEDKNNVNIKTSKKSYSLGEQVEFSAEVYDDAFNPISDAEIKIEIKNSGNKNEINLNSVGGGLYEGMFQSNTPGDYNFIGKAIQDDKNLGADKGAFNIGEVDIEMSNPRMNYEFLNQLANFTGGKYFNADNHQQLFDIINEKNKKSIKEKIITSELRLWSNEWLMIAVIILFALEWFFRKRWGML